MATRLLIEARHEADGGDGAAVGHAHGANDAEDAGALVGLAVAREHQADVGEVVVGAFAADDDLDARIVASFGEERLDAGGFFVDFDELPGCLLIHKFRRLQGVAESVAVDALAAFVFVGQGFGDDVDNLARQRIGLRFQATYLGVVEAIEPVVEVGAELR